MKNLKLNLRNVAVIVASLAVTVMLASCSKDSSSSNDEPSNSDPKSLVITNVSLTQAIIGEDEGIRIGIFPVGTTPEQAYMETGLVAGGSDDDMTVKEVGSTYTVTIPLYDAKNGFETKWTGSGKYDIYCQLGYSIYLRKTNVTIKSSKTTLDARDFEEINF